jgi:protein-disulfide isomerase
MVGETEEPGGGDTGPEEEASRPTSRRRSARAVPAPPVEPPRSGGLPPHIASALVSALVLVVLAPGLFVAGYFTNAAVDDDGGSTTVVNPTAPAGQTAVVAATPTPPVIVAASVDDDPFWGPQDAPVTIIEFSDFQCPFCSRFFSQTYPQIKQDYEGQVRFVYRDFPLSSIHPWAQKAAEAGECAAEQGKFWEYHDAIFQSQSSITGSYQAAATATPADASASLTAAVDTLKGLAPGVGVDTTAFNQCLDSGKYTQEVQKDYQEGITYGVTGTPAFFINGVTLIGAQPYANFKAAIDAALQEAGG